jgi:large subunit ribosomal protein L28
VWLPNVQTKKLPSDLLNETLKLRVTTRALRCIDRAGGLDNYLLNTKPTAIASLFGSELKSRVAAAYTALHGVRFSRYAAPTTAAAAAKIASKDE